MGTKQKIATRQYGFSDGTLAQLADLVKANITRDMAALAVRGVTIATANNLQTLIDDFKNAPTDIESIGGVTIAVQQKEAARNAVLLNAFTVRSAAANTFGEEAGEYIRFGFLGLGTMNDDQLAIALKRIHRIGTEFIAQLGTEGIDAAFMTAFDTAINNYDNELEAVELAKETRDKLTHERANKGNILYKEVVRLTNIGKEVFAPIDEATYNDYVIEHFTGTGNGDGDNPLTFSGTVTDNVTGEALADAELIVDGEVIATTNASGQFSKTFTITEVLTIQLVIKKPGYDDYESSVQFSPGVDLTQNVQMAAKVGSISGTASDLGTALGIGGTSITLSNAGTVINITADANGNYSKGGVRVGMYTATANAPGYIGQSVTVIINEDVNTVQNFSLVVVP